jgi:Fur family zinc uptake transcriptional regulator
MLTNARLFQESYQNPQSTNAAISQAKAVCEINNVKLTLGRERVLKIIWGSRQPLGAYQIQDQLCNLLGKKIAPPTVYRALAFLLDNGLVHKLTSINAYVGCPFPKSEHSNIFLVCNNCERVAEAVHHSTNKTIQDICSKTKFDFDSQYIEVFGTCLNCSNNKS